LQNTRPTKRAAIGQSGSIKRLLAESLLVIAWTAVRRVKIPFFIGISFCILSVLAQVIVLVNVLDISRWVVLLAVGLALVSTAVFVERKQEQIRSQTKLWREALETWH
jgi:predicted membrane channel-forming protein YqfA (hemolysin III family)